MSGLLQGIVDRGNSIPKAKPRFLDASSDFDSELLSPAGNFLHPIPGQHIPYCKFKYFQHNYYTNNLRCDNVSGRHAHLAEPQSKTLLPSKTRQLCAGLGNSILLLSSSNHSDSVERFQRIFFVISKIVSFNLASPKLHNHQ